MSKIVYIDGDWKRGKRFLTVFGFGEDVYFDIHNWENSAIFQHVLSKETCIFQRLKKDKIDKADLLFKTRRNIKDAIIGATVK